MEQGALCIDHDHFFLRYALCSMFTPLNPQAIQLGPFANSLDIAKTLQLPSDSLLALGGI
jgi:hypothetical protein